MFYLTSNNMQSPSETKNPRIFFEPSKNILQKVTEKKNKLKVLKCDCILPIEEVIIISPKISNNVTEQKKNRSRFCECTPT